MSQISEVDNEKTEELAVPEIFTYEFYESHRYEISQKSGY
jgi:hypothetical protein